MVVIYLTIYKNLFEILRSINIVENYVWLSFCLGPRMLHEGRTKCPRSIIIEECLTGVYDCHCAWLTMHAPGYCCMNLTAENVVCIEITEFSLSSGRGLQ